MDRGLEEAGFEHLGVVEFNAAAAETLRRNRPEWEMLGSGDVIDVARTLSPEAIGLERGELDLLAGGPPCQPFSLAAQWAASGRRGMQDRRAETVHATMRLVRTLLPRAVLMENVLGFVRGKHSALGFLQEELERISVEAGVRYVLHWRLLNAADYGVPQNRRRAIMVAIRDSGEWEWPVPTHEHAPLTAWDAFDGLDEADRPLPSGRWTPLLPSIPEGWNYQWLTERGGGEELFGYRTKYWNFLLKLAKTAPSWTLAASPGPSTGPFHWENRPLSVREQMRLQSFPDDWQLSGDYRTRTHQAGNATPPVLAEVLGRQVASTLGYRTSLKSTLVRSAAAVPPPPASPIRPIPAAFVDQSGPKPPHLGTGKGPAPRAAAVV
jgi:DNA (cytosine-5)-methyltransferase 1